MSSKKHANYNVGKALQRLRKDNGWTLYGFVAVGNEDAWILSVCLSEREIAEIGDVPESVTSLSEERK